MSCSKIESWEGTAWTKAASPASDGEPDDVLQTCFPLPIFLARLRAALEAFSMGEFEYLPIRVIRSDGSELPGFCIANVLTCVDGLDLFRSEYSRFPDDYFTEPRRGHIRAIKRAVLKSGLIGGKHVIRLSRYRPPLYVSESFGRLFQKGNFTGYEFREVELSE